MMVRRLQIVYDELGEEPCFQLIVRLLSPPTQVVKRSKKVRSSWVLQRRVRPPGRGARKPDDEPPPFSCIFDRLDVSLIVFSFSPDFLDFSCGCQLCFPDLICCKRVFTPDFPCAALCDCDILNILK